MFIVILSFIKHNIYKTANDDKATIKSEAQHW